MAGQYLLPVDRIWAEYQKFMGTPKPERTETLLPYMKRRCRIEGWEWEVIRKVYQMMLDGDPFGVEVIGLVNRRRLSLSQAEERYRAYRDQQLALARPDTRRRVTLPDAHVTVMRTTGFTEGLLADLRAGAQVNVNGMSREDVDDCIDQFRRAASQTKRIADLLSHVLSHDLNSHMNGDRARHDNVTYTT